MSAEKYLSKKIAYPLFGLIGFLFVFFCKAGADLAADGNILWTGSYAAVLLMLSLLIGGLSGCGICFAFYKAAERTAAPHSGGRTAGVGELYDKCVISVGRYSCLVFGLIVLSFLPVYLAFYPGICAYDITLQMEQLEIGTLNDHHPLIHTLLIKWMLTIGAKVFGDVTTGIALYTALQMIVFAAALSYGLALLYRNRVKWYLQLLGLLYCMFHPFHHYMAVSTTKDTLFAAFFLVFLLTFADILRGGRNEWKPGLQELILLLGGVAAVLFRNNAKYAMLVPVLCLLLAVWRGRADRKLYLRLLGTVAMAVVVGQIVLTGMFRVTGAAQGDKREMLSMPIQQLARCMIYHGGVGVLPEDDNTMSQEAKALVNDFLLNEAYKNYQASLADPVKSHTNTYVVRYRTVEFAKTYLSLLAEYPGDFINAALAVNAGYLYPEDVSHAYVYAREGAVGEGYVQVLWAEERLNNWGVYKDSKWPWLYDKMEKWADENAYLKLPLLKYLFVPGSYLWFYLLAAGYLMITRKFKMLLPLSLVFGYYLTLLLGPTVQLRYLYPLMIALPFLMMIGGRQKNTKQVQTVLFDDNECRENE